MVTLLCVETMVYRLALIIGIALAELTGYSTLHLGAVMIPKFVSSNMFVPTMASHLPPTRRVPDQTTKQKQ